MLALPIVSALDKIIKDKSLSRRLDLQLAKFLKTKLFKFGLLRISIQLNDKNLQHLN